MKKRLNEITVKEHLEKLLEDFARVEDYPIVYNFIDEYGRQNFPVYNYLIELNKKMDILEDFSIN